MAQATAFATGTASALAHRSGSVVQIPFRPLYSDCTSFSSRDLADATTTSLLEVLTGRGGGLPQQDVATALRELASTMSAMADGIAPPNFFLSSLDPGVGKTTALVCFVQELLKSERHKDVAVLLCVSRLEEIVRLVEEIDLDDADFAVLTSDDEVNRLSSTSTSEARVLFTTHSMVMSRCRGRRFGDADVFQYQDKVRAVRVWDEAMLPGELVSINTDQLASLRDPLRLSHPALAKLIEGLERELEASGGGGTCNWPEVEEATGVSLLSARRGLEQRHASYVDALYALSGRCILLRKLHNASTVITALDSRDAIPEDLAPMVILDASGRVRATYKLWEKAKGKIVRLPSAAKNYKNLTVHVMDKGSGKTAWVKDNGSLALDVARLIDSKPREEWLVVYHKGVKGGAIPDQIRGLLSTCPDRISFINWGKHQGTNEFRCIQNVILAGINNYSETDYEMMARYYSGIRNCEKVAQASVEAIEAGEHMHHILQALCRSSARKGSGSECGHCNAYIIAPKRSGICNLIPEVFPGCVVRTWKPANVKLTGWVADAVAKVRAFFMLNPDGVYLYKDLRCDLGITDASNFKKRVRNHESYKTVLEDLELEEVATGKGPHRNALAKKPPSFGCIEAASFVMDV